MKSSSRVRDYKKERPELSSPFKEEFLPEEGPPPGNTETVPTRETVAVPQPELPRYKVAEKEELRKTMSEKIARDSQRQLKHLNERPWTQTECPVWRPSLSPPCVIWCHGILGVLCLIVGIVTLNPTTHAVQSEIVEYDYYQGAEADTAIDKEDWNPESTDNRREAPCKMADTTDKKCTTRVRDRMISGNCALAWNGEEDTIASIKWGRTCEFFVKIEEDMAKPMFYYQLDHFFQNHRRYVKARLFPMERGQFGDNASDPEVYKSKDGKAEGCLPLVTAAHSGGAEEDDEGVWKATEGSWLNEAGVEIKDKVLIPCGLPAYSIFNDRFEATLIRPNSIEEEPENEAGQVPDVVECETSLYNASDGYPDQLAHKKLNYDAMIKLAKDSENGPLGEGLNESKCYKLCCGEAQRKTFSYPAGTNFPDDVPAVDADGMDDAIRDTFASDIVDADENNPGLWSKGDIAWDTDKAKKYNYQPWDPETQGNVGMLQYHQNKVSVAECAGDRWANIFPETANAGADAAAKALKCKQFQVTLPRVDDEDFIVWMRYAAKDEFSKLHRKLNFDLKKGDFVLIKAYNYFPLPKHGRKKVFFASANSDGGHGQSLGMLWIADAVICFIIMIIFTLAHCKQTKEIEGLIDGILHHARKSKNS